ncbi:retrovirus-related pol polyprotein from transposon TNT 1-94 [Tanacetum coccineum]|uniref:Retrovirus-related pol polyprotein from transposon TNT 1-94 n=1 Tax=Tanacetum coccineum TaxID=301880 RepID=A0ABQ5B6M4_9ASTR
MKPVVIKPVVENSEAKASEAKPKAVRKNNSALIIKEWVSDSEDEAESKPKIEKKTVKPSFTKIEFVKSKKQVKYPRKITVKQGNPQQDLEEKGVIDSGCSRHMTRNMSYLTDFEEIDGGYVAFGGSPKRGKITGKCTIKTGGLTFLFAKPTYDESNLWHRRLGHINFKTINKLVKGNLVRGLPSKLFEIIKLVLLVKRESNIELLVSPKQVLVIKPHNKTPYELFLGRKPALGFMKPFGCPITILNTIDHLSKFDDKADEGFFVRYSINSKAFRVFNSRTRIVEENLHVQFSENTPNIVGSGQNWPFDIDALTKSMNYKPVVAGNQSNGNAGTKSCDDASKARIETVPGKDYILLPLWTANPPFSQSIMNSPDDGFKPSGDDGKKVDENPREDSKGIDQEKEDNVNITNNVNAASTHEVNAVGAKTSIELPIDLNMPELEDIVYSDDDEDVGVEADMNNLDASMPVSPIPTTRVHKDHPVEQIIRDLNSEPQTRRMTKNLEEQEPKKLQEVWTLVDLPNGKRAIGTKWVFKNKKDEREIVIKNKARLVAQGYTQDKGIDYDEVFAPVIAKPICILAAANQIQITTMRPCNSKIDCTYHSSIILPHETSASTDTRQRDRQTRLLPIWSQFLREAVSRTSSEGNKDMQKNLALLANGRTVVKRMGYSALTARIGNYARECRKPKRQADWIRATRDEEIDEHELEAHYVTWQRFQEDDSNVIPDSSNICTNDNQVDQKPTECVDERAALANLIANLTLDNEGGKTYNVFKQLKKENVIIDLKELKDVQKLPCESSRAMGWLLAVGICQSEHDELVKKESGNRSQLEDFPYDTSDPANDFAPLEEETVTLEKECRSN